MRTAIIIILCIFHAIVINCQEYHIATNGGTWGDEPNFGAAAYIEGYRLTASVGYVFATTEPETVYIAAGIIPYQNEWYRARVLWGGEINNDNTKLILDNWFRLTDHAWLTVGVQSVSGHAYWNIGFAMPIRGLGKKIKPRRFF